MLDHTPHSRLSEIRAPVTIGMKADLSSEPASNRSPTSADFHVGRRIKELRRNQGLTQKHVARSIGVTGAQFHRYEVGATRVATSRLMAIAGVFGVRPEYLMSEAAPKFVISQRHVGVPDALATNDLVELVELFSSLPDQRRRSAMVTFARSLARSPQSPEHIDRN
jgi:transcriptional regulator with XRE-family HTH domain